MVNLIGGFKMSYVSPNRILLLFSILVGVSRSLSIIDDFLISRPSSSNKDTGVCKTKECLTMDENFSKKVDRKVDPCRDFFNFTCGHYIKSNETPVDTVFEYEEPIEQIQTRLYDILKEPLNKDDHRALKMTKEMYQSCMKHESDDENMKNLIWYIGGWALLDRNWKERDFSLEKFYSRSWEMGYMPTSLFIIDFIKDITNSRNAIYIRKAELYRRFIKIKRLFGFKKSQASSFFDVNVVSSFFLYELLPIISRKLKVNVARAQDSFKEFIRIDKLVGATSNYSRSIDDLDTDITISVFKNKITLSEMKDKYANFPWTGVIRNVFEPTVIDDNETIIVECPECLAATNQLVVKVSKRSLNNYLMWSLVIDTLVEVDGDVLETWLAAFSDKDLEQYCADEIIDKFRRVMDYEYIKRYFDKSLKSEVFNFSQILKNTMEVVFNNTTLMDRKTRARAIEKLKAITFKIAYDEEISSEQKLQQYFADLNVDPKAYLCSHLNISKFTIQNTLKILRKPTTASTLYLEATSNIAAYMLMYNAIFLTPHVLGHVYYSKNRPEYLNYGALGFVIGHELNHGFIDGGRYFNSDGNFENWWPSETIEDYNKTVDCFKEQYSGFINVETGNKVDGALTLYENLGDNGGIVVAYRAYEKYLNQVEEPSLPHFAQYTPRQMFWISFGATWCSKYTRKAVLRAEKFNEHARERVRVNGASMNSRDFARDWNCKSNTPMNPVKKCIMWD